MKINFDPAYSPIREVEWDTKFNPFITKWVEAEYDFLKKINLKANKTFLLPKKDKKLWVLCLAVRNSNTFVKILKKQNLRGVCIEVESLNKDSGNIPLDYKISLFTNIGRRPIIVDEWTEQLEDQYNKIIFDYTSISKYMLAVFNIPNFLKIKEEEDYVWDFKDFRGLKELYYLGNLYELASSKEIKE